MSDTKNSNSSTAIWVAVIGLVGVIIVGVLNNLDKLPTLPGLAPTPQDTLPRPPAPSPGGGGTRPSTPQPTAQPAAPNIISSTATGRVVDENGQPVAGAKVRCTDCLPPSPAVVTDSDGQFSLPFRVERGSEIQDIHLSVSGHKDLHSIRVSDPTGRVLRPN